MSLLIVVENSPPLLAEKVPQGAFQRSLKCPTSDYERTPQQGTTREAQCTWKFKSYGQSYDHGFAMVERSLIIHD